jgi:hypothetical protein
MEDDVAALAHAVSALDVSRSSGTEGVSPPAAASTSWRRSRKMSWSGTEPGLRTTVVELRHEESGGKWRCKEGTERRRDGSSGGRGYASSMQLASENLSAGVSTVSGQTRRRCTLAV